MSIKTEVYSQTIEKGCDNFLQSLSQTPQLEEIVRRANNLQGFGYRGKDYLAYRLESELLPQFLEDFHRNRFRIAIALTFLDSRFLKPEIREKIGLSNHAPTLVSNERLNKVLPTLFDPTQQEYRGWTFLCQTSEEKLKEAQNGSNNHNRLYHFLDCLWGKSAGVIGGLCDHTQEFPNGVVFIEGIWYVLRSIDLVKQIDRIEESYQLSQQPLNLENALLKFETWTQEKLHPYNGHFQKQGKQVHWKNCGGIWQPARALHSFPKVEAIYQPTNLKTFLS